MNFEMRFRGFVSSRVRLRTNKIERPGIARLVFNQPYFINYTYGIPDASCDLLI